MTDLITPFVNNNGTSREELVDQRIDASVQISRALDALSRMRPHGRDYQTAPDPKAAYDRDLAIHVARCEKLRQLWSELQDEGLAILEQGRTP